MFVDEQAMYNQSFRSISEDDFCTVYKRITTFRILSLEVILSMGK
jgi:hypothetical protein